MGVRTQYTLRSTSVALPYDYEIEGTDGSNTLGCLDEGTRDVNKVIKVYCKIGKTQINLDNIIYMVLGPVAA